MSVTVLATAPLHMSKHETGSGSDTHLREQVDRHSLR